MSILRQKVRHFNDGSVDSMETLHKTIEILSQDNEFVEEVLNAFSVNPQNQSVVQIGNLKSLLADISEIDSSVEKRDITVGLNNIYLERMLEDEVAVLALYEIKDPELIKRLSSDNMMVETRYSAKNDYLDIYNFSKFANFLRDQKWDDLITYTQDYIRSHSVDRSERKLRLIRTKDEEQYMLRAITSVSAYKNYGINFSVLVALLALDKYVKESKTNVYIDEYRLDDSRVYVSFQLGARHIVNDNTSLSLNLVLENDEIKDSAVSMNAAFKLTYNDGERNSYVYLRPDAYRTFGEIEYKSDLLTYSHSMNVSTVYEKIGELPVYINHFVQQVTENSQKIVKISNPEEVRNFILTAVKNARNSDFAKYKENVLQTLARLSADSIFDLFEALRSVEELFGDDISSREYWRKKLYNLLLNRGESKTRHV